MLIIERGLGEFVRLGDDIKVLVHKIKGSHVWLGFDAPRSVQIYREDCVKKELGPKMLIALGESYSAKLADALQQAGLGTIQSSEQLFSLLLYVINQHKEEPCESNTVS